MTPKLQDRLKEIKDRIERATPGPWTKGPVHLRNYSHFNLVANVRGVEILGQYKAVSCGDDAAFIAHAPTDLAKLIKVIEVYEESLEEMMAHLCDSRSDGNPCSQMWYQDSIEEARAEAMKIMGGE